jgi:crossover junction endodeoxyribonuclease RuvC
MRVLGVDTSLRSSGVAVIEACGNRLVAVEYGVMKTPAKHPHSECLKRLLNGLADLIERTAPDAGVIEGSFYCKNVRTAIALGEARGTAIAACAAAGLPVYEYSPRRVKQALVGYGAASKEQVRRMVMSVLGIEEEPAEDASDALAIAICHLHNNSQHEILAPERI